MSNDVNEAQAVPVDLGRQIVVLDRGFVYVGRVAEYPDRIVIRDAQCIRRWGTTGGLGQLAQYGVQPTAVLDPCGTVVAYRHAVIHLIQWTAPWTS